MSQQQQGGFSKQFGQQKKIIYQFTNQLVNNQFNIKIYFVLIIVQHLQILAFQCHSVYQYKALFIGYFRLFINIINPQYYLRTASLMNFIIPISLVFILTHIALIYINYKRHKLNNLHKNVIEVKKPALMIITHYFTVLLSTVFTIPILLSSLLVFYCHDTSPYHQGRKCYDTYHLFLILMAIVNILWTFAINIYYCLFYFTKNPFNYNNFLALSSSLWNLLKFTIKFVPICYLIFDQILEFKILFVFGLATGLLGYTAIARILYPYNRFNKYIERVMINIEITSIIVSLMFIVQAFFIDSFGIDLTFIISFVASIPLAKLCYSLIMQLKQQKIHEINKYAKDTTQAIEDSLIYLIVELENSQTSDNQKRFYKIVKFHHDKCQNVQCSCHQYLKNYKQSPQYYDNKTLIYKLFLQIINKATEANKKAYSLMILKSFIQFFKLKNSIKAGYIISKIMREKISFLQDYLINGFLYQISKSFEDTSNMEQYRKFSQHLIKFEKQSIKLAEEYEQFWHQISEQNSSLQKIMTLLKKTRVSKSIIDEQFRELYELYPTNIRITQIYKEVYKEVLIDYDQFMKFQNIYKDNCHEKQESKLVGTFSQMKFSANQDLIVINTSVNVLNDIFHGGCQIINVTSNVYKILGYSNQDLIGKNINRFLPKIYAEFHDQYINNYLSKNDIQIKPRELIIFPINSTGYLVECAMLNKIMPSLEYGANIISFLLNSKLSKQNLIIYDQRTGLIDSMSQKAQNLLIGKKAKTNSISIPDHITDILPVWDYVKEQTNDLKKKSARQVNQNYSNVYLYRSDGPTDNKYVKIVSFELAFQSKIFTMKECLDQTSNFWMGFQTLVENSPNKPMLLKQQKSKDQGQDLKQKGQLRQSPYLIQPQSKNKSPSMIIENSINLYEPLVDWYPRVYTIVQGLLMLVLAAIIVYNYINTLNYYDKLQNDIVVKQKIQDALALVIMQSHDASHYLFSGGDSLVLNSTNPEQSLVNLKQLISLGQYIYQQIVDKQRKGQISLSDLTMQVQYFNSPSNIMIKEQSVTDACYQLVLYLIEIYKNSNPIQNLPNNILFVFKNCINIIDQFESIDEVFTVNLQKNSLKRISQIQSLVAVILSLFCVSLIWESIYKLMIAFKINKVIQIYQAVPIEQLQKYPKKCINFVKFVCPVEPSQHQLPNTVKSIKKLGDLLKQKAIFKQSQNDFDQLMDEDEQSQFITFSNSFSTCSIIIQSFALLLIFSTLYVVGLTTQNSLLNKNLSQVNDWNNLCLFKSQLLRTLYYTSEYKNLGNQWSSTQLNAINKKFIETIQKVQSLLKNTNSLDNYLSKTYQLVEQSVFIINDPTVESDQFLLNQQKITNLSDQIQNTQIDQRIELDVQITIDSFLSMLQLIVVGQIIIFICYFIIYIPKSYKIYLERSQISKLMYDTLGYKLQNLAKQNLTIR